MLDSLTEKWKSKILDSKIPIKLYEYYIAAWITATSHHPVGTNVFDLEWDTLILLDTCRVDALREVAPEYDFLNDVGSILSVGSTSNEWIANTFTEDYRSEIRRTAYVTSNANAETVLVDDVYPEVHLSGKRHPPAMRTPNYVGPDDLLLLDQVWKYNPDETPGHVHPKHLTDRAISVGREYQPDRLIVHYSHPHVPYVADAISENRELYDYEKDPIGALLNGEDFNKVWEAYLNNLRFALEEVEVLLKNLDAETVAISADHGEAFGEWGIMYGHKSSMPVPAVKRVPWATTNATDNENYDPTLEPSQGGTEQDVDEQLEALGYK